MKHNLTLEAKYGSIAKLTPDKPKVRISKVIKTIVVVILCTL